MFSAYGVIRFSVQPHGILACVPERGDGFGVVRILDRYFAYVRCADSRIVILRYSVRIRVLDYFAECGGAFERQFCSDFICLVPSVPGDILELRLFGYFRPCRAVVILPRDVILSACDIYFKRQFFFAGIIPFEVYYRISCACVDIVFVRYFVVFICRQRGTVIRHGHARLFACSVVLELAFA